MGQTGLGGGVVQTTHGQGQGARGLGRALVVDQEHFQTRVQGQSAVGPVVRVRNADFGGQGLGGEE